MSLHKLHEPAPLARRNLDIGDFAKALEEGAQFVFGHVAGQPADEDGSVVRVRELVHRLRCRGGEVGVHLVVVRRGALVVETHWAAGGAASAGVPVHAAGAVGVLLHAHWTAGAATVGAAFVFGRCGRDAHGSVAAVDALHGLEGALLLGFVGEADEAIAARHAGHGVGHDFGGFTRGEFRLEEGVEDVFVYFGTEVTDEDGELGTALFAADEC